MNKRVIISFFITFLSLVVRGQAVFSGPVSINDLDTTTINVQVQELENDDLTSSTQGVCAVKVDMRHDFVGDLKVSLVSPSGQSVQLMGPAVAQAPGTQFVQWRIQFNASAFPVFPDGTFDDIWNNLNSWTGLGTAFVGTYYPYSGNLEDINLGSAIGTWKLEIIDQSENGEGIINSFEIVFCDPSDLEYTQCDPGEHDINITSTTICQYNDDIESIITNTFIDGEIDSLIYDYSYALFSEDGLVNILPIDELAQYAGDYTICGVSYLQDITVELNNIPSGFSPVEFQQYIEDNNLCVSISNSCQEISFIEAPELVTDTVIICEGQEIILNGEVYNQSGQYEIYTSKPHCDSLSILVLEVIDNVYEIEASTEMLTCLEPLSLLSISNYNSEVSIEWTTLDGLFLGDSSDESIEAIKPGTYSCRITRGDCVFNKSIVIDESSDFVFVIMEADTIDCNNPIANINIVTEDVLDSVKWISSLSFVETTNGIQTSQPGVYAIEFFAANGCNSFRGIEVIIDSTTIDIEVANGSLGCNSDSTIIFATHQDEEKYDYQWSDGASILGIDSFLVVYNVGTYFLHTKGPNGCIDTATMIVSDEADLVYVDIIIDTITCVDPEANLSFASDVDPSSLDILWNTYSGLTAATPSLTISQPDTVSLSLMSESGCRFDTSFVVLADTMTTPVSILNTQFECQDDSLQLVLVGLLPTDTLDWTGPFFTSTESSPYIYESGEYTYSITSENGCTSQETIHISGDSELPEMNFNFGELNCELDTIEIIPSLQVGFTFNWTSPNGDITTGNTLLTTEPGLYFVEYRENISSCKGRKSIQILKNETDTLENVSIDNIDCDISVVRPQIIDTSLIRSAKWYDIDNGIDYSSDWFPTFSNPGFYSFDYELKNGCLGSDTIQIQRLDTPISLTIFSDTITCSKPSIEIRAEVDGTLSELTWIYPDTSSVSGLTITTSQAGTHTAYATSTGNCKDTVSIHVPIDTITPQVILTSDGNLQCEDPQVLITQTSMESNNVSWSGPGIVMEDNLSIVVDSPGIYFASIIGNNGCTGVGQISVESDRIDPSYIVEASTIDCNNSSSSITIFPDELDYSIQWNDSTLTDFENTVAEPGTYYFTIFNSQNCEKYDSLVVEIDTSNQAPNIEISNVITCFQPLTEVFVSDVDTNAIYTWSGPGIIDGTQGAMINVELGGIYSINTIFNNGCDNTVNIEVEENSDEPNLTINADTISCSFGKAYIDVQSDQLIIDYNWSGPQQYESNSDRPLVSEAGTYFVTVTGENGCMVTADVEVVDTQVFPEIKVDTSYLRCDDEPLEVSPSLLSEGATLSWLGPEDIFVIGQTLKTTIEGEYIAVALNDMGCVASDTFQVLDQPILPIFDYLSDSLYCNSPTKIISVDTEDDLQVTWTRPDGSISTGFEITTSEPGDFILTVLGINGCKDSTIVNIPDARYYPIVEIQQLESLECNKESVDLMLIDPGTDRLLAYKWFSNNGQVDPNNTNAQVKVIGEGTYFLEVTDVSSMCVSIDTFELVREDQSFTDVIYEINVPTCQDFADASIEILEYNGDFPPYNMMLDDVNYGEQTIIQYLEPGSYIMTVTDSIGCQIEKQVIIEEGNYPYIELPNDTIIQLGDSVLIEPFITPDNLNVEWNITTPCDTCTFYVFPEDTYYIEVTVSDELGCSYTDDMLIKVSELELKKYPNIFSPNGDDYNDFFYMPYTKGVQQIESLRVFDWNGVKVYEVFDIKPGNKSDGWNGNFRGQPALTGVYLYEAVIKLIDGSLVTVVGDLTLIR